MYFYLNFIQIWGRNVLGEPSVTGEHVRVHVFRGGIDTFDGTSTAQKTAEEPAPAEKSAEKAWEKMIFNMSLFNENLRFLIFN